MGQKEELLILAKEGKGAEFKGNMQLEVKMNEFKIQFIILKKILDSLKNMKY